MLSGGGGRERGGLQVNVWSADQSRCWVSVWPFLNRQLSTLRSSASCWFCTDCGGGVLYLVMFLRLVHTDAGSFAETFFYSTSQSSSFNHSDLLVSLFLTSIPTSVSILFGLTMRLSFPVNHGLSLLNDKNVLVGMHISSQKLIYINSCM